MRKHRKSATKLLLASIVLTAGMSLSTFAMTAEEVTAKTPTSYTAGTNSIYGPSLNQDQLNAVAQATADFVTNNITDNMSTDDKIKAAYDYIKNRTTYVDWNAATGANTAYTLVTGQGACSGMCRSMKALCDAIGIECYHVHSTQTDHQWNLVRFGDGVLYHVDIDANKSAGQDVIYKSLTHPLPFDTSAYPAVGQAQEQTQPTTPQPTDGQHTMRASQDGANAGFWLDDEGHLLYIPETHNNVFCDVIDKGVSAIRFRSSDGNINPANHYVLIYGAKYNADLNTWVAYGNGGVPIRYDFEYDKPFSLDFTGNNMTADELSNYCIENDIIINVAVIDDLVTEINPAQTGLKAYICYATPQSVPTGEIG